MPLMPRINRPFAFTGNAITRLVVSSAARAMPSLMAEAIVMSGHDVAITLAR